MTISFNNEDVIGEHSRNMDSIFPNILKQIIGKTGGNESHISDSNGPVLQVVTLLGEGVAQCTQFYKT